MRTLYVANLVLASDVPSPDQVADVLAVAWGNRVLFGEGSDHSLEEGPFDDGSRTTGVLDRLDQDGTRLTRLRLTHPDREDPAITRTATVWVVNRDTEVLVRIRLGVTGAAGELPARVSIAPPRLVRQLLDVGVIADGRRMTDKPVGIDSTAVHEQLVPLLNDHGRTLPVILLTTPYSNALFPPTVARRLAGLAHVFTPASIPTTYTITAVLGREWTAFNGAVRIYWPGLDFDGDPRSHSLLLFRDRVREDGLERLHATITGRYTGVWSVPTEDRQLELARAKSLGDDADWLAELERAIDAHADAGERLEAAQNRIEELEMALEQTRADLELAQQQIGLIRSAAAPVDLTEDEPPPIDPAFEPADVADAVRQANREAVALVFLEEAFRSAEDSHFPKPEKVLDELRQLDQAAQEWTGNGIGWKELLQQHGLTLDSGVSQTALGLYPDDYRRTYNGKTITLGPHIRHGTKPRSGIGIYWCVDEEDQRLIVGHVGDKLRDTTNR